MATLASFEEDRWGHWGGGLANSFEETRHHVGTQSAGTICVASFRIADQLQDQEHKVFG